MQAYIYKLSNKNFSKIYSRNKERKKERRGEDLKGWRETVMEGTLLEKVKWYNPRERNLTSTTKNTDAFIL